MNWYYAEKDQQRGPLREEEFQILVQRGIIRPETLVWHEGLPDWRPYLTVKQVISRSGPNADRVTAESNVETIRSEFGFSLPEKEFHCSECGSGFPSDEMCRFGDNWVCSQCNSHHIQGAREGPIIREAVEYGGFWIRGAAKLVDGIILRIASFAIQFFVVSLLGSMRYSEEEHTNVFMAILPLIVNFLVQIATGLIYNTWFIGRFGATPGKMACNLKVITADGSKVSYIRAFSRYWSEMLSGILLFIGYIMAGVDEEKRTLHDRIVNTRVIKV